MRKEDLLVGFSNMLGVTPVIKPKATPKKPQKLSQREEFLKIFQKYETVLIKSLTLTNQYEIDLGCYEEPFYDIIDDLMKLNWPEGYDVISYFLYHRVDGEGNATLYVGDDGVGVSFKNPEELYDYLHLKFPKKFK